MNSIRNLIKNKWFPQIICIFCFSLLVVWASSLAGCKKKPPPKSTVKSKAVSSQKQPTPGKKQESNNSKQTEPAEINPSPVDNQSAESENDEFHKPVRKRDPFKTFIRAKTPDVPKVVAKKSVRLTPLQRYSLDQLKVVGIMIGGNVRKVLLEDDAGKGYSVNVGDAIGNQSGIIVAIKKDRMIVEETYENVMGKKRARHITKKLYTAEGGENP